MTKGYVLTDDTVIVPQITGWQSYTPAVTLVGGTGNTVPVYTTNSGRWERKCNTIFVDILLQGDGGADGAGTGVFNISLPITAGASSNADGIGASGFVQNGSKYYTANGSIGAGTTTITMTILGDIKNFDPMTGADQDHSTRKINLHFWYEVDN